MSVIPGTATAQQIKFNMKPDQVVSPTDLFIVLQLFTHTTHR